MRQLPERAGSTVAVVVGVVLVFAVAATLAIFWPVFSVIAPSDPQVLTGRDAKGEGY